MPRVPSPMELKDDLQRAVQAARETSLGPDAVTGGPLATGLALHHLLCWRVRGRAALRQMPCLAVPLAVNFWLFEVALGMVLPLSLLLFTRFQSVPAMNLVRPCMPW